mmetsp:Transcript_19171/g.53402  ORF Transcript_19171/g.53402 Transcript_19171/m.53402 type:complete len:93 (+) Transcript_19171:4440-4718(+)
MCNVEPINTEMNPAALQISPSMIDSSSSNPKEVKSESVELILSRDFIAYRGSILPDINELPFEFEVPVLTLSSTDEETDERSLVMLIKSSIP